MPLKWRKQLIAETTFESAGIADLNNDGVLDIACGEFWYEGPDFKTLHRVGEIGHVGGYCGYWNDFSNIFLDVNGDGNMDYITGAWFTEAVQWRENPGDPEKEWPLHEIGKTGNVERVCAHDIDGDGVIEIIPNCPGDPVTIFKLVKDADGLGTGEFTRTVVGKDAQGHGIGFGDIAGNGRCDIALWNGWLEAPEKPYEQEWIWHPEYEVFQSASTPMLVVDVTGNGLNDLIVGGGHCYGLDWYEQKIEGGKRTWIRHPIDPFNSQYHDMKWIDIDGDGQCELVTGKRYRAHNGGDPGTADDYGIYYFKWTGEGFAKQIVCHGPARETTGLGIYFDMADLTGNGLPDIVAPGKDGLYVFYNEGLA